ncbi:MAG: hypothetical protein LIO91_11870, partial [Bacteroidales bacterium]|nr:hypothetical protein [Bacteroidales bacterium]
RRILIYRNRRCKITDYTQAPPGPLWATFQPRLRQRRGGGYFPAQAPPAPRWGLLSRPGSARAAVGY